MTAASTGPTAAGTPGAGPRPQLLTLAAILLGVTAVLAIVLPLSLYTDRTFVGCSVAVGSANASPTSSPSSSPSPSPSASPRATTAEQLQAQVKQCEQGNGTIERASGDATSTALRTSLLSLPGLLPVLVLAGLAFIAYRGVPLGRWFIVGVWVLSNLLGLTPFAFLQFVNYRNYGFPPLYLVVLVLGLLTFTAAAVLVNLRPVTRYYSARRPIRTAGGTGGAAGGGGLLGSLFRPRPPAGGTPGRSTGPTVSTTKPPAGGTSSASTRPSGSPAKGKGGGSGNTGRAKGKRRG